MSKLKCQIKSKAQMTNKSKSKIQMTKRNNFWILTFELDRLLKKSSTALITQTMKNDYTDISMSFNL